MNIASNKSLFDLLTENLFDINYVARMLHLKNDISVEEYMIRYQKGGLQHKFFKTINDLCVDFVHSKTAELEAELSLINEFDEVA